MTALADKSRPLSVQSGGIDAFRGVSVAFTPTADREIRDGVVIRLEHFRISENFVSEGVEPVERDSDGSGGDEVLEVWRVLEVICRRSSLQSAESDVSSRQRRNVAELVRAKRLLDVILENVFSGLNAICGFARGRVELVRFPRTSLARLLEDGEGLWHGSVEPEPDVSDVERLL